MSSPIYSKPTRVFVIAQVKKTPWHPKKKAPKVSREPRSMVLSDRMIDSAMVATYTFRVTPKKKHGSDKHTGKAKFSK